MLFLFSISKVFQKSSDIIERYRPSQLPRGGFPNFLCGGFILNWGNLLYREVDLPH